MKLSEIRDVLKAEVLAGEDQLDKTIVGAGGADLMDDVLSAVAEHGVLLTGLMSDEVIRTSKIAGVGQLSLCGGKGPRKI